MLPIRTTPLVLSASARTPLETPRLIAHDGLMRDATDSFKEALSAALTRWGLPIDRTQLESLHAHFQAMVETNRVMNLTRITGPQAAAVKHYADSLALLKWIDDRGIDAQTVLDIGTGAGFPALPLAVMRPDWSVTAIDATRKKIEFLQRTAATIGLTNLHCSHAHAQHWRPGRKFHVVVFRALTSLAKALQQSARHAAPLGSLVAYKTASIDRGEQDDANALTPMLRLTFHERYAYDLELGRERMQRLLLVYKKST